MSGKILLIYHMKGDRIDRAHPMLERRGFDLQWCAPALGDRLPDPGSAAFDAVVVYGGAQSANDGPPGHAYIQEEIGWIRRWVETGKPYLGFCLGAQLLSRAFGGRVAPHPEGLHEIGHYPVEAASADFAAPRCLVYHWHKEGFEVPEAGELLARGADFPNQAFRLGNKVYGLQFHPEVTETQMLSWMDSAEHMLRAPGAHDRARQLADARLHNQPLGRWLEEFLDHWLESGGLLAGSLRQSGAVG